MLRRSFKLGVVIISLLLLANIANSAGTPYLGISLAAKIPPSVAAHLEIDGGAMIIAAGIYLGHIEARLARGV